MKLSLAWVQEFTTIDRSVEELADLVGSRLVEVEEIIHWRDRFTGVIVAEITEVKPHENADKLNIFRIKISNTETRQVVSGDKTLQIGDKVGYIAPGITVPGTYGQKVPVVIQQVEMRGVASEGMLGSGKELCLNEDHSKVQVLDTDKPAGTSLLEAYNLDDIVLDIDNKSFTHRPDCFGLLGLAREIAAIQGHAFESPTWFTGDTIEVKKGKGDLPLEVKNDIPELCRRFSAVTLADVTVGPSSLMMQSLLLRMGVKPINNIVDITNYLMLLTGQPMHAYDYDKVRALDGADAKTATLVVRHPKKDEKIALLNGKTITPHAEDMLVASATSPICMGGAMGGTDTEVTASTTNIILESANWDMYTIRKTSMRHGLFTDAVTRNAKGQSPSICAPVLGHGIGMILEENEHAKIASELIDIYPSPKEQSAIRLNAAWVNGFLGTAIETSAMVAILRRVEFTVSAQGDNLTVTPPLWRSDIAIREDVTDEIGRLNGFDTIEPTLPLRSSQPTMGQPLDRFISNTRQFLANAGANEALTYNFVSSNLMQQTNQEAESAFHLTNSLSPELAYIRTNLLGSLLAKVHLNHKSGFDEFALYELGKTSSKEELDNDKLPIEHPVVAWVYSATDKAYDVKTRGTTYYQAKYCLEQLLHHEGIDQARYRLLRPHTVDSIPTWLRLRVGMFDLNRSAIAIHDDIMLGVIGEPTPAVRRALKLPPNVAMFECHLGEMLRAKRAAFSYKPLSRFPATDQDICFKVPAELLYDDLVLAVIDFLRRDKELESTVSPVDIFQREDDTAHKQTTIRLRLGRADRTLTTVEVNELLEHLATHIRSALRAERV
jgi:phenylalanyl-tRNA synthetase beta chain